VDAAEMRAVKALGVGVTTARKIVRDSYSNLGRSVAEILRMSSKKLDLDELVVFERLFDLGEDILAQPLVGHHDHRVEVVAEAAEMFFLAIGQ